MAPKRHQINFPNLLGARLWFNYQFLWLPVDFFSFEYFGYLKLDKNDLP